MQRRMYSFEFMNFNQKLLVTSPYQLRYHKETKHYVPKESEYNCSVHKKVFSSWKTYHKHMTNSNLHPGICKFLK
jgi:hypothetical protein